jgi:hypothetical protein
VWSAKYMVINKSFVNFLDELCHPHLLMMGCGAHQLQRVEDWHFGAVGKVLLVQLEDELGGGQGRSLAESEGFLHFGF